MEDIFETAASIVYPDPASLDGDDIATIDAFLGFQRGAIQLARQAVDRYANDLWNALGDDRKHAFSTATSELSLATVQFNAWRRAWWLHVIGGHPRAPFETVTPAEMTSLLNTALRLAMRPDGPRVELQRAFLEWWASFVEYCRTRVVRHVESRITQSKAAIDASTQEKVIAVPRRKASRATWERIRVAERQAITAHRVLGKRFELLGPVCGECTRESGGCCTLTVPLLWREADFRLLALGNDDVPEPAVDTAGACPFLGLTGCRLPADRRPFICRSFLCDRAEATLGDGLSQVRRDLLQLGNARSQLGG